ncbi:MAG: hypothetical protein KF716_10700 [Anaerolineae bacterium]|nr:hypothetical protein [Anaerolineae bacterium]
MAYAATFIARDDMYPLQLENGRYISIQRQLYPDLIAAHLKGFITIGAYALDRESIAKWVCLDADDQLRWHKLIDLAQKLTGQGITAYLEPSRRGGHLWLFTPPLSGTDARRFGKQLLTDHKLDKLRIELYPKQDKLVTGPGSFVRLPLGKHRLTNKYYPFITIDGLPLKSPTAATPSIRDQIKVLTNPVRIPKDFIDDLIARSPLPKTHSPTPKFEATPSPEVTKPKKPTKKRRERYDSKPSERIKASMSVQEFVSQYMELNDQLRGHCPFHEDQINSFSINPDHNFWHCFACERGGSIIDFWMLWRKKAGEDYSFKATITELAQKLLK